MAELKKAPLLVNPSRHTHMDNEYASYIHKKLKLSDDVRNKIVLTEDKIRTMMEDVKETVVDAIQKAGHENKKRNTTSTTDIEISSRSVGLQLLGSRGRVVSSSKVMDKIELSRQELEDWFDMVIIPDCVFTGKLKYIRGHESVHKESLLTTARFESGIVKIKKYEMIIEIQTSDAGPTRNME